MAEEMYGFEMSSLVAFPPRGSQSQAGNVRGIEAYQGLEDMSPQNWREMIAAGLSLYCVSEAVFQYCASDSSTRAFVFFSLTSSITRRVIRDLLANDGLKIVYATDLELTQVGAQNLIELCYGHNTWMNQGVLKLMTRERLGLRPKAHVVFFTGWEKSWLSIFELKASLRALLPAHGFQRKLHATDEHSDTMVLAEALSNPNTLDLLNRVPVSRTGPLFSRLPEGLRLRSDVCIDGSSVLELYGLRIARDLDLVVSGQEANDTVLSIKFDPRNHKYRELPLDIPEIVESPYTTLRLFGYRFLTLRVRELLLSFEASSNSHPHLVAKARRDLRSIAYFYSGNEKERLALSIYIGTLLTQLRILFEFLLTRVLPLLPKPLVGILRRVWKLTVKGRV